MSQTKFKKGGDIIPNNNHHATNEEHDEEEEEDEEDEVDETSTTTTTSKSGGKKLTVQELKDQKTIVVSKLDRSLALAKTLSKLEKDFGYYGKIVNIACPANGQVIKGYAFIEFKMMKKAKRAVSDLSKKKLYSCSMKKGRDEYLKMKDEKKDDDSSKKQQQKQKKKKTIKNENEEEDNEEENTEDHQAANDIMKLALEAVNNDDEMEDDDDVDSDEDLGGDGDLSDRINAILGSDDEEEEEDKKRRANAKNKRKGDRHPKGPDVGRTIFVRNLPFDVEIEDINDMFSYYYGPVEKVTVMPHREYMNLSNGSAFVLFKDKDSVDQIMRDVEMEYRLKELDEMSKKPQFEKRAKQTEGFKSSAPLQGTVEKLEIEGRHPIISRAISRDEAEKKKQALESQKLEEKDRRNLYLAQEGYVPKSSPIAATLPPKHLEKIQKNYEAKMQKLKNPVYHVSRTRLSVQNLPKNMTDDQLKQLFMTHCVSEDTKDLGSPKIKYCRIERDKETKKLDAAGNAPSKGFGFVEFEKHEHALAALRAINNNPHLFEKKRVKKDKINTSKRLIVEFALDNVFKLRQRQTRLTKQKEERESKNKELGIAKKNRKRQRPTNEKSSKEPPAKKSKPTGGNQKGKKPNGKKKVAGKKKAK